MRVMLLSAVAALALAACQKNPPAPEANSTAAIESAASGQDEPGAPFNPAAPEPPRKYEAMSKTAMALTGPLTLTPTASGGPNLPPGAIFSFERGFTYTTTLMPGAATDGSPAYDWAGVMPGVSPASIQLYSVDSQDPAPAPGAAGLCDGIFAIAVGVTTDATGDMLHIAAFSGNEWPPANTDTALCGTYMYAPVNDAAK